MADSDITEIDDWCRLNHIDCIYFLKKYNISDKHILENLNGFKLIDIRVSLSKNLNNLNITLDHDIKILIETLGEKSIKEMGRLINNSFVLSRFFVDTNFNVKYAQLLYHKWLKKHIAEKGSDVLCAKISGKIVGFISYSILKNRVGQIGLFAVNDKYSRIGIGSLLLKKCIQSLKNVGIESLLVVTQGRNIQGNQFYIKSGFEIINKSIWFHKWYN